MQKITETCSELLLKPFVQLPIYNHVGFIELLQISTQALPQPPLQECEICLHVKKKICSSFFFCLDSFSMLVLAERLGSSQPLNTRIDFSTISNGGKEKTSKNTDCFGSFLTFMCARPTGMGLHVYFTLPQCENLT